jgi:hypothetical protein
MDTRQQLPCLLSHVIAFRVIVQGLLESLEAIDATSFADLPHTDAIIHVREIQKDDHDRLVMLRFVSECSMLPLPPINDVPKRFPAFPQENNLDSLVSVVSN